jgi:hypothetical protein
MEEVLKLIREESEESKLIGLQIICDLILQDENN